MTEPAKLSLAPFVDKSEDPQIYVDRYNSEADYKKWFDENYPQYATIYEAVGLDEPVITEIENVPIPDNSIQTNSTRSVPETIPEPTPDSIPDPIPNTSPEPKPVPEPVIIKWVLADFVDESQDPQIYVDRYNSEADYKKWFDENYPQYATIYEAVGLDESATDPATDASESGECGIGTYLDDGICVIATQPEDAPEPAEVEPAEVDSEIEERLEKLESRVGILEGLLDSLKSIFGL